MPEISFVTIDNETQKPLISWISPENISTIDGYIIKRLIYSYPGVVNNTFNTIATIYNPEQTNFIDNTTVYGEAIPAERQEVYRIVAFKYNGNDIFMSLMSEPHSTMLLQTEHNRCLLNNKLRWNRYAAWDNNIAKYKIYNKNADESFVHIGNTSPPDTVFVHSNIINGNYYYFVTAVCNNQIESNTNIAEQFVDDIQIPQYLKVDSVIVNKNNLLEITFDIDENYEIEKYQLFKSNERYKNFVLKDEFLAPHNENIKYSESEFNSNKLNYYYMTGIDSCGDIVITSDTINNIVLNTNQTETKKYYNELNWTNQENINEYEIFRSFNSGNYENINITNDYFFEDNVFEFYENQFIDKITSGKFCYFITTKNAEKNRTYKSNEKCLNQISNVYIANAFSPNSSIEENRIFRPKIAFVTEYSLIIYNRLGVKVFETNNPNQGWNGQLSNGEVMFRETYFYYLKYNNSQNKTITKSGWISIL